MTTEANLDDRLIAPILRGADQNHPAAGEHPDEETLALFAQGELDGAERAALVRHLADCPDCRATAGLVLSLPQEESIRERFGLLRFTRQPALGVAAAASILVAAGLLALIGGRWNQFTLTEPQAYARAAGLLKAGEFDQTRDLIAQADRQGLGSARLRGLEAQAVRQMPVPIALAMAGRLTDFGFDGGGVVARGPGDATVRSRAQQAVELLDQAEASSADLAAGLNRGHALLALDRPREARDQFQRLAARAPAEPLARLGEGLADFLLEDYPTAERAFRACLKLDPHNTAARFNLALTLEEQGQSEAAVAEWETLLSGPLPGPDRTKIQHEIEELRKK